MPIPFGLERLIPFFLFVLCFGSGLIAALAMAPAYQWIAMFAGVSLFYVAYVKAEYPLTAMLYGLAFGFGYHLHGLFWIGNALLVAGNDYAWAWPLAVIGLPLVLGLFVAVFIYLPKRFGPEPSSISGFLAFVVALSVCEWVRGHIFTGFPWNLYGQTWIAVPAILQSLSIFGIYGLTAFTIFITALPGWFLINKSGLPVRIAFLGLAAFLFSFTFYAGHSRLYHNPTQYDPNATVRVVQPSIEQEKKWKPDLIGKHFSNLIDLSKPNSSSSTDPDHRTYIIWPETAIPPVLLNDMAAGERIETTLSQFRHPAFLLTGALRTEQEKGKNTYFNSLIVFNNQQEAVALYDKSHLVPFGEYIPFQDRIPLKPVAQFSGFQKGPGPQTLMIENNHKIAPLVCYEIIFPHMARAIQKDEQSISLDRADFIVAVTNDGWYGNSPGPFQHFDQAVLRAVEQGIPVARSANTGISGIIDAHGRILTQTNLFQKVSLSHSLPKKLDSPTFFSRFGNWVFFAIILIMLCPVVLFRR